MSAYCHMNLCYCGTEVFILFLLVVSVYSSVYGSCFARWVINITVIVVSFSLLVLFILSTNVRTTKTKTLPIRYTFYHSIQISTILNCAKNICVYASVTVLLSIVDCAKNYTHTHTDRSAKEMRNQLDRYVLGFNHFIYGRKMCWIVCIGQWPTNNVYLFGDQKTRDRICKFSCCFFFVRKLEQNSRVKEREKGRTNEIMYTRVFIHERCMRARICYRVSKKTFR